MDSFVPVNRLERFLRAMDTTKAPKPKTADDIARAKNFRDNMKSAKLNTADLVEAVNGRGIVKINAQQVRVLRSAPSSNPRNVKELGEIAEVLGVSPDKLFSPPERKASTTNESEDEFVRMCRLGLFGPKSNFLKDAIEMAYSAAITSRVR